MSIYSSMEHLKMTYTPEMYKRPEDFNMSNNVSKQCAFLALSNFFTSEKKKFKRVIDVGCGDGSVTEVLNTFLNEERHLTASDISKEMVDFAKDKYRHLNADFVVLDICGLIPFELRGKFDLVFTNFVLNWTPMIEKAVASLYALLAPEGKALFTFLPKHTTWRVYRLLAKDPDWSHYMVGVEKWMAPYQDSDDPKGEFEDLLNIKGFKNCEVIHGQLDFKFNSFNQYKLLMRTVHPNLVKIPEDLRDKHMECFMEYFVSIGGLRNFDPDTYDGGPVFVPYEIIIATADK